MTSFWLCFLILSHAAKAAEPKVGATTNTWAIMESASKLHDCESLRRFPAKNGQCDLYHLPQMEGLLQSCGGNLLKLITWSNWLGLWQSFEPSPARPWHYHDPEDQADPSVIAHVFPRVLGHLYLVEGLFVVILDDQDFGQHLPVGPVCCPGRHRLHSPCLQAGGDLVMISTQLLEKLNWDLRRNFQAGQATNFCSWRVRTKTRGVRITGRKKFEKFQVLATRYLEILFCQEIFRSSERQNSIALSSEVSIELHQTCSGQVYFSTMFCPISPWAQRLLSRSTLTVDAAPQQHARHHHSAQPVQAHERELPGAAPGTTRKGRTSPSPTLYQHWILYQNTWAGLPKSWSGNRTPRQQVGMAHLFPNVRFQAPRSGMGCNRTRRCLQFSREVWTSVVVMEASQFIPVLSFALAANFVGHC